jgi:NAD(P)-dependent dehydrogenase (short-subunit alcohol dehydrogenase family)
MSIKNLVSIFSLKDKVCLITGGFGLLGREFVRAVVSSGATVVIVDILSVEQGKRELQKMSLGKFKKQVFYREVDISDEKSVKSLLAEIKHKFKKIDFLVNNAYPRNKNYGKKLEEVDYINFCENIDKHLGGYYLFSKEAALIMKQQKNGVIVNLGSIYGFAAPRFEIYEETKMTMPVEYAAIKGGVLNLTRYFATYFGKYNIRVNSISPGGIFVNQNNIFVKKYLNKVILGKRKASPRDISGVLVFLLSDAASYITGQNIVVDGGWTL